MFCWKFSIFYRIPYWIMGLHSFDIESFIFVKLLRQGIKYNEWRKKVIFCTANQRSPTINGRNFYSYFSHFYPTRKTFKLRTLARFNEQIHSRFQMRVFCACRTRSNKYNISCIYLEFVGWSDHSLLFGAERHFFFVLSLLVFVVTPQFTLNFSLNKLNFVLLYFSSIRIMPTKTAFRSFSVVPASFLSYSLNGTHWK